MNSKLLLAGCLSILVSFFTSLNAQVFQPLGNGLTSNDDFTNSVIYENQGEVYVFYEEISYNPYLRTPVLKKWDGISWLTFPTIPLTNVSSIRIYKGDLYIAAYDWSFNGNLYKFDGTSWVSVLSNFSGKINDMEIQNNRLICGGAFSIGTPANHNILAFDGTSTVSIPSLAITDSVSDVNIIGNEIWVAGIFMQSNGLYDSLDVLKLTNNTQWERVAFTENGAGAPFFPRGVFEYNGKVYCGDNYSLYEILNDTARFVGGAGVHAYAEFDGKMFLSTNYAQLKIFDGNAIAPLATAPQNVESMVANSGYLFATFRDTSKINGVDFGHVFKMGPQSLGLLYGKAYLDHNNDCAYDPAVDESAPSMNIQFPINGVTYYASSDGQGNYSMFLPAATYPVQVPQSALPVLKYYIPSCNLPTSVSVAANQSVNQDFVFVHDGSKDLESEVYLGTGNRSRQGFTETGYLYLRNPGVAISSPVTVRLTIPNSVSFISSTPPPSGSSGNVYSYTFPGIGQGDEQAIKFYARIDLATNAIGDTLTWYSEVAPLSGDVDSSNDSDTSWTTVVAACDPNDKTPSIVQSLPGLSRLDYHIRFQNTGTDTAYKVVIVDTLESYFDPASMVINGASHDYSFHIADNNVVAWTFDNILLPDSGANYTGSQGFVNFSIDVDPTLQVGDIIDNDAEIYFDFQLPVHTNHAQTAIVSVLGVEELFGKETSLSIYPNPARNVFYIENSVNEKQDVKLVDATGRIIKSISLQPESKAEVRAESLAPGMYFINNGENTHRVIITH